MSPEPMTVLASEVHILHSAHTGRTYRITISLPLGYSRTAETGWPFDQTPDKWPAVYVLDGNWYAAMVAGILRPMAWCGKTSDAIVVGIGYPEGADAIEAFRESFTRRDHDMTPVRDDAVAESMARTHGCPVPNGDSANFHAFIRDELIPFVERTTRANPAQRVLAGHSYGGLFGLYGLFETPGLFECLVLGSPTVHYGNHFIVKREAAFAQDYARLPARVFMFIGDEYEDDMDDTLRLVATLQSRGYEGFSLVMQPFSDQNHCEVAAPGLQWGLKRALKRG